MIGQTLKQTVYQDNFSEEASVGPLKSRNAYNEKEVSKPPYNEEEISKPPYNEEEISKPAYNKE